MNGKVIIVKYTALCLVFLTSIVGISFTESVEVNIIYFLLIPLVAIILVKADLIHPYTWYSSIFALYAIGYPVIYYFGGNYDVYVYTKSLMLIQATSLWIILMLIGPKRIKYKAEQFNLKFEKKNPLLFIIMAVIISLAIIEVIVSGYSHKNEIYASGSIVVQAGFRLVLLFIIVYVINQTITFVEEGKFNWKELFLFFLLSFLLFFFSGERDILLRAVLVTLFLYYIFVFKQKWNIKLIGAGFLSLLLIPILAQFKYFGLTGNVTESEQSFILKFFNSEFASASKNLQIILISDYNSYFSGNSYIWGIARSLNIDAFIEVPSISSWYNETFFSEKRAGQGFSILAEGFVNQGILGILVISLFLGITISVLYRNSMKNIYFFVFYLLSVPIYMYSLRADLANILTPLISQNLLFLMIIIILNRFLRGANIIKQKN